MSLIMVEDDSSNEFVSEACPSPDDTYEINIEKSIQVAPEAPLTVDETGDEISYDDSETTDTDDNSSDDEDKPLLALMKNLINYNGKQTTKLTNSQLVDILKKEFDLDVTNLHFICTDIYMCVLKKFLKLWPEWDAFDQVMHEARCMNDNEEVERILEQEYNSLKEYLAAILKASKPFAKEAAQNLKHNSEIPTSSRAEPGDVILEVNCTRDQLNTLFFRKPHPEYENSIFNIDTTLPSKIMVNVTNLQSMLNSCYVNVTINMACLRYTRECLHNYKHTLVNNKLRQLKRDPPLHSQLQAYKNVKTTPTMIARKDFNLVIDKILRSNRYSITQQYDVDIILKTISDDLTILPESYTNLDIPCTYRYHMSKYPYVRYLYKDVNAHSDKYDFQLEEKISPMLKFHVSKVNIYPNAVNTDTDWLRLECTICQLTYHGVQGIELLKCHFREAHQNEPNWICTHCDKEFAAPELAAAKWRHKCDDGNEVVRLFE